MIFVWVYILCVPLNVRWLLFQVFSVTSLWCIHWNRNDNLSWDLRLYQQNASGRQSARERESERKKVHWRESNWIYSICINLLICRCRRTICFANVWMAYTHPQCIKYSYSYSIQAYMVTMCRLLGIATQKKRTENIPLEIIRNNPHHFAAPNDYSQFHRIWWTVYSVSTFRRNCLFVPSRMNPYYIQTRLLWLFFVQKKFPIDLLSAIQRQPTSNGKFCQFGFMSLGNWFDWLVM